MISLLWLVSSGYVLAQTVPPLINYQGRLANPDGSFLSTGDYTLTFKVYDAATNGSLIWGPQVFDGTTVTGRGLRIPVVQGYFSVMLGPWDITGAPLGSAFNATNRFVEITVGNNSPITPRQQILTTPYAFQAQNAATMNNADWSAVFGTNDPVNGKIPGAKIQAGTISANQIASQTITPGLLAPKVTGTNVPSGGVAISGSSGMFTSTNPLVPVNISNLNLTITTRGNPVEITFASDQSFLTTNISNTSLFACSHSTNGAGPGITLILLRDGTQVGIQDHYVAAGGATELDAAPGMFRFLDLTAQEGPHIYQAQIFSGQPGNILSVYGIRMMAHEE